MTVTLTQLHAMVRQRADMKEVGFVEEDELTNYINAEAAELHDLLVQCDDHYFDSMEFSITTGSYYSVSSSFYKLRMLERQDGGEWWPMPRFNLQERAAFNAPYGRSQTAYRVMGSRIYIEPSADAAGNYRLWYVPSYTNMTTGSHTVPSLQNWHEYIVLGAAIRCLQKEESDVSSLLMQKRALADRIRAASANTDSGLPPEVVDVRGWEDDW